MNAPVQVDIDDVNRPYWEGLNEGQLKYQSCSCGHRWLPARKCCPACLSDQWSWCTAAGTGTIRSWVVYHVAYHPDFKDRVPYNVAIVRLDEGPQLITNINAPNDQLSVGALVRFSPTRGAEQALAAFSLGP